MLTIKDVAALAGVSKSTVSRVLNNNGYVNDETRQRILKIIKANNYSPSATAINLSKRETTTIGVVIPEIDNSFFGEVLQGITSICDENDLSIICCDTQNNAIKEERALRMLEQQRVRGVIITPAIDYTEPDANLRLRTLLNKLNVPIVVVDRDFENSQWDGVFYENYQSAYCATSELIKAGNRRIGIITGDMNLKLARERFQGFQQAIKDHGLSINQQDVLKGDFTIKCAYELAKKMYLSKDFPKAMVTCNNRTTLGFIKATNECGYQIGKDIALIGIDHVKVLDILDYNFSYVTRDTNEMGCIAMQLLLDRIKNPAKQRNICMMPYHLVLQGSEKISG